MKAEKRVFWIDQIVELHVQAVPELVAFGARRHRGHASGGAFGAVHVVPHRPAFHGLGRRGVLDPNDRAAGAAHRLGQAIDVGHDLDGFVAQRVRDALHHEAVLQIDDDERGFGWVERVEHVLATAASHDVVDDGLGDRDLVHGGLRELPQRQVKPRRHAESIGQS